MKLLIYSHAFAPQVGGVETFAASLASGLMRRAPNGSRGTFDVTVVTNTPAERETSICHPGFTIVRRPPARSLWGLIGSADRILLAGPAILPLAFALLRRKPVTLTHHGYQAICPNGMLFHLPTQQICPGHFAAGRFLECVRCNAAEQGLARSIRLLVLTFVRRALSRLADFNVGVSEHTAARLALPRSRVIRNGVAEQPENSCGDSGAAMEIKSFAYVGRLVAEKGVSVLIQAVSILKHRGLLFRVLIIGDGPQRRVLQDQASSLGLDSFVSFLGMRTGAQLVRSLTEASAIIMPAVYEDPAPLAALEQMMQGRLIIASELGGLTEELGTAGLTFPAGDALTLAGYMQRVLQDPELVRRLGNLAKQRALQTYTLERMLLEYRELLGSHR